MSIVIPILTEFQGKALKDAQKGVSSLEKSAKKLGGALAAAFSARKIIQFSKASVRAFLEEDKAVKALALNLQNLGLAYDTTAIERYIRELQYASGVADSELRPAFQQLVSATRDITASQDLLGLALDVSAGSGKSLSQVVQALSRSYLGTNTSLTRLNLGLTKAELKTKKFDDIAKDLSERFSGQSAKAVQTYAGKLAVLSAAAGDAQEILGEKLVQSIELLVDSKTGVPALAKSFEDMATFVGNTVLGFADFIKQVKTLNGLVESGPSTEDLIQGIPVVGSYILLFQQRGQKLAMTAKKTNETALQHRKELQNLAVKQQKTENKITKELTTQEKLSRAKLALAKAGSLLDLEKIQIEAALQGELTENEKLRLQLMKTIVNENADRATTLAEQLGKSQAELAKFKLESYNFKPESPFDAWLVAIEAMRKGLASIGAPVAAIPGAATPSGGLSGLSVTPSMPESSVFGGAAFITPELATRNPTGVTQINVTVQGTGGLDEQTKKAVVDAVVEASSYGTPTNWFRTTGSAVMPI